MEEPKTIKKEDRAIMVEVGKRLRAMRDSLGFTLEKMYQETGISGSYISDFERGKKYPSSKYLKELVLRFNVSLDYIYAGKGEMFIREKDSKAEMVDFGTYSGDIEELLYFMKRIPNLMFSILEHFHDYKVEKKSIIDKVMANVDKREEGSAGG